MEPQRLIKGFEFAIKHNLTRKEMEALLQFLESPKTRSQVAETLGANPVTLHSIIQRLKLKGVLILDTTPRTSKEISYIINDQSE